jgi:nucleotide-binding universal stress UspA family protein
MRRGPHFRGLSCPGRAPLRHLCTAVGGDEHRNGAAHRWPLQSRLATLESTKGERHGWVNRVWCRRVGRLSGRTRRRGEAGRAARSETRSCPRGRGPSRPVCRCRRYGAGRIAPQPKTLATRDDQEKAGARLLEEIAADHGLVDVERRVVVGFPAERLADLADDEDAELIVVGSRGRGRFKAAFLGSVSSSLVGVARCPVLIVPPGAAEAQ